MDPDKHEAARVAFRQRIIPLIIEFTQKDGATIEDLGGVLIALEDMLGYMATRLYLRRPDNFEDAQRLKCAVITDIHQGLLDWACSLPREQRNFLLDSESDDAAGH
jgi:hypothetical protein